MIRQKAVEGYNMVDGLEDNSPMDTNLSADVYQKHTVGPERLDN
jgi:hypothetical protein